MTTTGKRRLGRPPASSSADTRDRILDVARRCFGELGYETTTNKYLSGRAGITTGAIYHYFESKLHIYVAVHDDVQDRVYRRFEEAVDGVESFVGQLDAVLDRLGVDGFGPAVVAYEPVWAIGTGKTATPEQAEAVHRFIRAKLADRGGELADATPLLYGGSVKGSGSW